MYLTVEKFIEGNYIVYSCEAFALGKYLNFNGGQNSREKPFW
jgi:hypothetical protein